MRTVTVLLAGALVGATLAALPAAAGGSPAPLRWGMNVPAIAPLAEAGATPDFAMTWVGVWNRDNWGPVEKSLATMKNAGVTPVIQWYYWGDDISPACVENGCWSTLHGAQKSRADWDALTTQLAGVIRAQMGGAEVLLVLETEFNKGGVDSATYAPTMDALLAAKARELKGVPGVKVVVGFGSWGSDRWTRFSGTVGEADFVGTQALRSSVRQTKEQYLGVVDALVASASTMNQKFPGKAVFVTDLAFSSYPEPEWAGYQAQVIERLWARAGELAAKGVAGLMYRGLFDVPMDTANYHGEAERWWGLKRQDGSAKPSYQAWLDGVGAVPPPPPPGLPVPGAIEAEAMKATVGGRQSDAKASGGAAWNLWSNGELVQHVEAQTTGEHTITIRARGTVAAGVWPAMKVYLGDALVAELTVGAASYQEQTARATLSAGASTKLRVAFTNDHRTSTEDRNLVVDLVRVAYVPPPNAAPTASFAASADALDASFDASASRDADGDALSYAWDFGDGAAGAGLAPSHAYATGGTYAVTLVVTDARGATARAASTITVNRAPGAAFAEATEGLHASFDASASADADGDALSYSWSFGDGASAAGVSTTHEYATGGTYPVALTVTDAHGASATVAREITVNRAPTAAIASARAWLTASFDASGSSDADGDALSYAWDFGDGSAGSGATASHAYAAPGRYEVRLVVSDGRSSSEARAVVDATLPAPVAAEAESFAVKTKGGRASDATASGGAFWNLWSNGFVEHALDAPMAGAYTLDVTLRGRSALGVAPRAVIAVDGIVVAEVDASAAGFESHRIALRLAQGAHLVRVTYVNDHRTATEDRNLHVDRVVLAATGA